MLPELALFSIMPTTSGTCSAPTSELFPSTPVTVTGQNLGMPAVPSIEAIRDVSPAPPPIAIEEDDSSQPLTDGECGRSRDRCFDLRRSMRWRRAAKGIDQAGQ